MGMKDNRSIEERLFEGKENYQRIPVPAEMKAKLEEGIRRAEEELNKEQQDTEGNAGEEKESGREKTDMTENKEKRTGNKKKVVRFRLAAAAAAAVVILIALPNTGAGIAHAMGSLPVVGKLFQAVTFRDYQYESERFDANVEVPQIVMEDAEGEKEQENNEAQNQSGEQVSDKLQETVEQINFDIEEVTNQLIEEFQASADLGESYGSLEIHHETVTDNERYFTLKLSIYQGAGSGAESYKFYTIDKTTGEQIQIGDLFKPDSNYKEILSENIRNQMRAEMKADENKIYWVDYEEMPALNWEGLNEDQNFYFDEAGNIVISFDEYEAAPGYMGALEFTVERSVFEDMLK